MTPLLVAFSTGEHRVSSEGESIFLAINGDVHEMSRKRARQLQEALGQALVERREFFRTAGEFREDGTYVVERRGADSAGNSKVFESFDQLVRLYRRLPDEFSASEVGRTGITGSRRHMLVRHFAEHPTFDCEITTRNPLTVQKKGIETANGSPSETEGDTVSASAD